MRARGWRPRGRKKNWVGTSCCHWSFTWLLDFLVGTDWACYGRKKPQELVVDEELI